eukprot:GEMP01033348.1.p1 GENE.GEMP01033348.1~~GEMP01033348.1.p1  ORF type:complete len:283 (+),score=50.41 GEMP01033348.1:145-993(+)
MTWSKLLSNKPPTDVNDFMVFEAVEEPSTREHPIDWISSAFVGVSSALAAAAQGLHTHGVLMSCIPVIVPFSSPSDSAISRLPYTSERSLKFQKLLISATIAQGSVSLFQFIIGDTAGGFLGLMMAGVGCYSAMPHGIKWLPTYIIMSFINGSIEILGLAERTLFGKYALLSLANPWAVNVYHGLLLSAPMLTLAGAYVGYQLLKEIRLIASGTATPMLVPELNSDTLPGPGYPQNTALTFTPFAGTAHQLGEATPSKEEKHPKEAHERSSDSSTRAGTEGT